MRSKEPKWHVIPGRKVNSHSLSKIKKPPFFPGISTPWIEPNHEVEDAEVAACRSVEELRQISSPVACLGSCLCSMQSLETSSLPSTEFTGISHSTQLGGLLSLCQCWVPPVTVLHRRSLPLEYLQDNVWVFFGDVLLSFFFLQLYLLPIRKIV